MVLYMVVTRRIRGSDHLSLRTLVPGLGGQVQPLLHSVLCNLIYTSVHSMCSCYPTPRASLQCTCLPSYLPYPLVSTFMHVYAQSEHSFELQCLIRLYHLRTVLSGPSSMLPSHIALVLYTRQLLVLMFLVYNTPNIAIYPH